MLLNIAFQFSCKKGNIGENNLSCLKILCSLYLSRILREKPVAIFRITIFLAINMAFWNISNIESRQVHYSFCFCLFESLRYLLFFQSLIDLESIFVESLNIFKVGVSIISLAGIFCPPPSPLGSYFWDTRFKKGCWNDQVINRFYLLS